MPGINEVEQHILFGDPRWVASVVEHLGDPRHDHRWPFYILDAIGARRADQRVAPLNAGGRVKLCVF